MLVPQFTYSLYSLRSKYTDSLVPLAKHGVEIKSPVAKTHISLSFVDDLHKYCTFIQQSLIMVAINLLDAQKDHIFLLQ